MTRTDDLHSLACITASCMTRMSEIDHKRSVLALKADGHFVAFQSLSALV